MRRAFFVKYPLRNEMASPAYHEARKTLKLIVRESSRRRSQFSWAAMNNLPNFTFESSETESGTSRALAV